MGQREVLTVHAFFRPVMILRFFYFRYENIGKSYFAVEKGFSSQIITVTTTHKAHWLSVA